MINRRAVNTFQIPQLLKPVNFTPDAALKRPANDENFQLIPLFRGKIGLKVKIIPKNID